MSHATLPRHYASAAFRDSLSGSMPARIPAVTASSTATPGRAFVSGVADTRNHGNHPMKRISQTILVLALAAGLGVAVTAAAQGYDGRYGQQQTSRTDMARVTRVERMASHDDPYQRQECWNERTSRHDGDYYRDDSGRLYRNSGSGDKAARTLIGAIIGGALGNQVGDGRGRTAATIAGAAVGASVGNRSGRDGDDYRADHDGYDRYRDSDGVEVRCR